MSNNYQSLLEHFEGASLHTMMGETPMILAQLEQLHSMVQYLKEEMGYTLLLDITAVDNLLLAHPASSRFEVVYLFRHEAFEQTMGLKLLLVHPEEGVSTITDLYGAASWLEREVWDQYGIPFQGHSTLKRILNHNEFVGHPMRKDYEITKGQYCTVTQDMMDEMKPLLDARELDADRDDLMILNLGPSHPASHGTIRTLVALDGEKIVAGASEIGYLHRGFEKSCENHTYNQIVPYTDRLNYCSAITNNVAFVKTVEEMLGVEITPRATTIRVLLMELSRIMDHLVCLAAVLVDMGALTNYWYLYNPREDIYDFLSKLTGARLTN